MLEHSLAIPPDGLEAWLKDLPAQSAVFALFGPESGSGQYPEPYISKTANLRRRMHRLLAPAFAGTKRLHLGGTVVRLDYSEVGSDFTTSLLLLQAVRRYCGERVRRHLHLRPPIVLRLTLENAYPRVYVTNRIAQRALASTYGPFPSRAAAERYLDDSLNFFELRRCTETLHPDPAFPGCVYSEMKMCLAPCFKGCTDERYVAETARVREYLNSRGAWTIALEERARDAASSALDFEKAARLHQRIQKMKAVAQQVAPIVHPLAELDAVLVQPAASNTAQTPSAAIQTEKLSNRALRTDANHVAVFLIRAGRILGPGLYSVQGMRHPNEHAGSTSLFAHPTLLEPVPIEAPVMPAEPAVATGADIPSATRKGAKGILEQRLQDVLDQLEARANAERIPLDQLSEHLSLLARWYYRPLNRRTGEIFFRTEKSRGDSSQAEDRPFPLARIVRGISRVFCGQREMVEPQGQATVG